LAGKVKPKAAGKESLAGLQTGIILRARRISPVFQKGRVMALQVIGSGFGRTGTSSLKIALEILGFGPCHHMDEVLADPSQVALWQDFAAGKTMDVADFFTGYRSQVDFPGAHVWRESAARFPKAKVLHSVRPEEKWWTSYSQTIGKLNSNHRDLTLPGHVHDMIDVAAELFTRRTLGGDPTDRDACLAAYRARQAEVEATIAPGRLLVYDVAQGWGPLCAFLEVPVPEQPFPRTNDPQAYWQELGAAPT
jgi:Sulfotransferase domain